MIAKRTYPKSVQPGIPRLSEKKEEWHKYFLGDLFDVIKRPANIQDDEKYRLVTVRRSRGGMANRSQLYGREISVKSQFFLRTGDFLISKRQIVHGACAIVTEDFDGAIVSNEYSVLRCKQTLLLDYFAQLSHSIYLQQTFFHSSIGVHIEKMIFKLDDWFKWPINIPTLPEQQKIATFLSAVDKKLGHLRRKHELLESYKRGVMQKIFAPFDSAQGKPLRFKQDDGADFPDWESISFENIAKRVSTKFNPKNSNETPVLIELENIAPNMGCTIGQSAIEEQSSMKTKFNSGDVLFGKLRPYLKKFAQPSFNGVCSSEIWVLRGLKVSNNFLFFLIQTSRFMQFANQSSGSKMPRSDWNVVKNSIFKVPPPEEQQKIANFLSTLDKKLEAVQKQIDQTETFKKGLLQKMFV